MRRRERRSDRSPRLQRPAIRRARPTRTLVTAIMMGSAAIRTIAIRAASTAILAEYTSKAIPHADGRCDVLGVLVPTGDASIDIGHQKAGVEIDARNWKIVD